MWNLLSLLSLFHQAVRPPALHCRISARIAPSSDGFRLLGGWYLNCRKRDFGAGTKRALGLNILSNTAVKYSYRSLQSWTLEFFQKKTPYQTKRCRNHTRQSLRLAAEFGPWPVLRAAPATA